MKVKHENLLTDKVVGDSDYQVTFVKNGPRLSRVKEKFQCAASGYDYSLINMNKAEINMSDIKEIRVEFCQSKNRFKV